MDIAPDKRLHFLVSLFLVVAFAFALPLWVALTIAALFGIGKEAYDSRAGGSGWDWNDLVADAVGCLVGVLLVILATL